MERNQQQNPTSMATTRPTCQGLIKAGQRVDILTDEEKHVSRSTIASTSNHLAVAQSSELSPEKTKTTLLRRNSPEIAYSPSI